MAGVLAGIRVGVATAVSDGGLFFVRSIDLGSGQARSLVEDDGPVSWNASQGQEYRVFVDVAAVDPDAVRLWTSVEIQGTSRPVDYSEWKYAGEIYVGSGRVPLGDDEGFIIGGEDDNSGDDNSGEYYIEDDGFGFERRMTSRQLEGIEPPPGGTSVEPYFPFV